jgi:ABC-2 type transport system ATP-binding protein
MIKAKDLSKDYDSIQALRGVSFEIGKHEVVGLLGPNGAGKTTLIKILAGYLQPTSGTAWIDGIDVIDDPISAQLKIGYMAENSPLYPDMLVQEYLQLMAALRQIPPERQLRLISLAARQTGIQDYLVQPIGTLSKGYRQRVALAQAILHQPEVLILDEPTSGMDPNQIVEIRRLIRRLAKKATVLLSTHILTEVELTCDRVLIIMNGKLQTDAKLEELKSCDSVIAVIPSASTGVEEALSAIQGARAVARGQEHDGLVTYRVAGDGAMLCPAIFDLALKQGWRLNELHPERKTLESVFRDLGSQSGGNS